MAQCEQCRAELPPDSVACPGCGSWQPGVPDDLIGRELLGRYRIVRLLAEGGMGRVYLAEQAVGTVMRRVAVKVLRRQLGDDRQLASRFSREAETLVRLTHPNTVQLFDFGALPDGTLALVMEYVEGHSLARELAHGPLSLARAERLLAQIAGALKEAHAHGIVHRDLKPDNLLIAERPGHGDFVKVLDFGIAKVSASDEAKSTKLTQQGMIIGTPPYMSPEQFSGEAVDARSDVYSLGVIVYEMLTGKLPFLANTPWEWASKHLTADPAPLPLDAAASLSPRHANAVRRALAKRADERPQSVDEFLALFTGGGDGSPRVASGARFDEELVPSTLTGTATESLRPRFMRRALVGAGAIAGLALIAGIASLRAGSSAPRPPDPPAGRAVEAATVPSLPAPLPSGLSTPADSPAAPAPRARPALPESKAPGTRSHRKERSHGAPVDPSADGTASLPAASLAAAGPTVPEPEAEPEHAAADHPPAAAERPAVPDPPPAAPAGRVEQTRKPPAIEARAPAPAPAKLAAPPADLQQRIAQIQSATASRLEVAVGLYQAAAGKYGQHPALQSVRSELASAAEPRIKALLAQSRCAQAQALQRALKAISAASSTNGLFGKQCPAP